MQREDLFLRSKSSKEKSNPGIVILMNIIGDLSVFFLCFL